MNFFSVKMDDLLEFAGKKPCSFPKSRTPLGVRSVFDFNVDSAGLEMEDFGRESLGIIDIHHPDFRRESISFLYDPVTEGRESLGIINLNDDWKSKNPLSLPQITITDSSGYATNSLLNRAFITSLLPSDDSVFSFNSNSLDTDGPSRIFSTCSSGSSSVFNEAFSSSAGFLKQLLKERYHSLFHSHERVKSLPSELEAISESGEKLNIFEELQQKRKIKSDNFILDVNQGQDFLEQDDKFDDSVFLEANHMAHKVANTSNLDDSDLLDCTQEPADLMIEVSEDDGSAKCDTETVFKAVDKILPPVIPTQNIAQDNLSQNTKVSFRNDQSNMSNKSNNSSRDPREIINSLSEFLNKVSPTEEQKTVGQNLLSSLAEIINGNSATSNHLDDSGHSSSESDFISSHNECHYEVLDLRKKCSFESSVSQTESCEACVPLDLSLKSKSANSEQGCSPKILPSRFANGQQKLIKESSVSSNENQRVIDPKIKFKPKKIEEKSGVRKGPLKAVIPVSNMARRKSVLVTPTRTELHSSKYLKKTSTPINKFNVKPMAQSTPEGCGSAISPLNTPNSSPKTTKQKLNYSGSSPHNKSQSLSKSFTRRHSVSDMKQTQAHERFLKRSNSVGEDSGLKATAVQAKQNISKTAKRSSIINKSVLQENRNRSIVKPLAGKKGGKENVC